jgi:predicted DNA-binding transcriptional regulator AlpA
MGRMVDVDDLVGSAEIARRLGAKRYNLINDWIRRYPHFPQPVATIGTTKVWVWSDVRQWYEERSSCDLDTSCGTEG